MGDTNRTERTHRGGGGRERIDTCQSPTPSNVRGRGWYETVEQKKTPVSHKAQKRGTKDLRSRMKPLLGVGINRVNKRTKQESGIQGGDGKEYVYG